MSTIKLALASVLGFGTLAALAAQASAAPRHHGDRQITHGAFVNRDVALPYVGGYARGGRYSGPFRTDSAPLTGGGY